MASRPPPASPTTATSSSRASSARIPSRTMAWSSTMSTRIAPSAQRLSPTRKGASIRMRVPSFGALSMARLPPSSSIRSRIPSRPIPRSVSSSAGPPTDRTQARHPRFQSRVPRPVVQGLAEQPGRGGVADDVADGFLHDAEEGNLDGAVGATILQLGELAADRNARPAQLCSASPSIAAARPRSSRTAGRRLTMSRCRPSCSRSTRRSQIRQRRAVGRPSPASSPGREELAGLVVELPRDAPAFVFLSRDDAAQDC